MKRPLTRTLLHIVSALTLAAILSGGDLWAQSSNVPPSATTQSAQPHAGNSPQPPTRSDELTQMRTDLNRMESLLGNMSAEIEFLHDQNLQILLRTNAQMWTVLIRDLQRQVDRQEQPSNSGPPGSGSGSPPPNAKPR